MGLLLATARRSGLWWDCCCRVERRKKGTCNYGFQLKLASVLDGVEEERGTTGSSGLAGSVLVERKDLESV